MIIHWSLLMHKKSKSAYRYARESGMIQLPSERILTEYRCYRPLISGVDNPTILDLKEKHDSQDVSVLVDEMKIASGLVYNASSGDLCGFVDSLDTDSMMDNILLPSSQPAPVASHSCFFIRGCKSDMQAVVGTYATHSLTVKLLYNRFWEVVASCELAGFRVRCCVSDGASTNRKFYKLHHEDFPNDSVTCRAINRFSADQRILYFCSDTCHLMKTTRNCFENSGENRNSRKMVVGCRWYSL